MRGEGSQIPRNAIGDERKWSNEIPTVPVYYLEYYMIHYNIMQYNIIQYNILCYSQGNRDNMKIETFGSGAAERSKALRSGGTSADVLLLSALIMCFIIT